MPVNVEIKCSLRNKFEGLQCPELPAVKGNRHKNYTNKQVTLERVTIFWSMALEGSQSFMLM